MKLKFKNQKFQTDAAKAVTDSFQGQQNSALHEYTLDLGSDNGASFFDVVGFRNHPISLPSDKILENVRAIQMPAQLRPSETIDMKDLRLTIEMETGTGKTYTYIKTMYELNKLYGWSKFIIVVPSIAIREGVCKSFEIMSEHFASEYGKRIQSFVYDSKQLTKIDQFASDSNMHVMIINTQAFAARGEDARRIYMRLDAFRSRKPIDVIAATNPILIIDEPQSVLGADRNNATRNRLKEFNPLFTLLYSATHRAEDIVNMVYRLDAMDAYNQKLVKKISVKGIEQKGTTATNGYLYLESIELSEGNPRARIGFDKKTATGTKQVTQLVADGFDIYQQSGQLEEYSNNYRVESIDGYART
ncbi:MAG: DEAD/DEAH box helicase family protein, partial [Bacteroidaceae bacterium]|nr:DEAD/DEAH box helicase family protein [Bacteroidaceae bacterium]